MSELMSLCTLPMTAFKVEAGETCAHYNPEGGLWDTREGVEKRHVIHEKQRLCERGR